MAGSHVHLFETLLTNTPTTNERPNATGTVDAWGQAPGASQRFVPLVVTGCTVFVVAFINGVATWSLILVGGSLSFWLPFAAHGLLLSVELCAMVRIWFDFPNVSRGLAIGATVGGAVFLFALVLVVQSLGAG